jgi:hypothetical protein
VRPFQHALSSAAKFGTDWRADIEIHEFIDSSKTCFADIRHRMILHSVDLGAELAAQAFPSRSDTRQIVCSHVEEDLGHPRRLSDWFEHCDLKRLPVPVGHRSIDKDQLVDLETERQGLPDRRWASKVFELLALPSQTAPESGIYAWCILGNSLGPAVVRKILGTPFQVAERDGAPVVFDPGWCAERMIYNIFRGIPEMRAVVLALKSSHQGGA